MHDADLVLIGHFDCGMRRGLKLSFLVLANLVEFVHSLSCRSYFRIFSDRKKDRDVILTNLMHSFYLNFFFFLYV
jgi:hypothetical protein